MGAMDVAAFGEPLHEPGGGGGGDAEPLGDLARSREPAVVGEGPQDAHLGERDGARRRLPGRDREESRQEPVQQEIELFRVAHHFGNLTSWLPYYFIRSGGRKTTPTN